MRFIRIRDPRSLESWFIKETGESATRVDSSFFLMHHDPSDFGSLSDPGWWSAPLNLLFLSVRVSFDPWSVTFCPPLGELIWVRRHNNRSCHYTYQKVCFVFSSNFDFYGDTICGWIPRLTLIQCRVATVREKSGKIKNFSRSGKSQGILQKVRENLSSCQSQWKVREFCFQVLWSLWRHFHSEKKKL